MIRLVLDTNILVSANVNGEGLEALVVSLGLNKKVQLCVSELVFKEYAQVLSYPRLKFAPKEITAFLERLRSASISVAPTHRVSVSPDEPDNRFLECAESAGADFLVTGNKRHFPKSWKSTEVVNARELLGMIGSSLLK
jgi:putative PIN family toxin of toxin-antitoxin system